MLNSTDLGRVPALSCFMHIKFMQPGSITYPVPLNVRAFTEILKYTSEDLYLFSTITWELFVTEMDYLEYVIFLSMKICIPSSSSL